jgi:hypothetical protein
MNTAITKETRHMTVSRMKTARIAASLSAAAIAVFGAATSVYAHHSFAMFDLTQHRVVEGRVTDWAYNNPHSWLHIEAEDENGEMKTWSFEGAAPVHATRQGVNGNTFRKGELVRVVMSPLRDGRPAGALCFVVKEDGSFARPNDGVCNSTAVIEQWQADGLLERSKHLDVVPAIR